jgi:hypothetical protein
MNTEQEKMSFAQYLASIKPFTVGDLRKVIEGLPEDTQILIGSPESATADWYLSDWFNVSHNVVRPDIDPEYSALTFYLSDDYDSRQF